MSTFYDPATIRRLAETGDAFYRGAAWILDQQDAARISPNEAGRSTGPHLHFSARGGSTATPNAADLGALSLPRIPRSRPRTRAAIFMPLERPL